MFTKSKFNRIAMAVALSVGVASAAVAAEGQSSAMRGVISGPQGNPAAGSVITILHQPSGTVKEVTVNADGQFSARGLRVGGPYTIIIESDKFQSAVIEDVYLDINDAFVLDQALEAQGDVERITVTGARDFFANKGSSSVFGQEQLNKMPTFNRDIKDVLRANPLAVVDGDELSVAGSNPKYNGLTIDGVGVNDTFGLQGNGYPTNRPPISLDAVSQVSIDYSPFSARAGKFGGGNISVVTKSGTNEFHGTAFIENVPWTGDAKDNRLNPGNEIEVSNDEESYGFTVGGPILKDKLFFFGAYEHWEEDVAFDYNLSNLEGSGHDVTNAEVDQVVSILQNTYGLTDSIGGAPAPNEDEKILIKLDWNINSDHRADFTYSDQDTSELNGYTQYSDTVSLLSNQWTMAQTNRFYTGHLYSDWSADFQTEASLSYKEYKQASNTNSNWGEINIRTADGTIVAGQDENRQANELANEVWNFGLHATYLAGDVEYKFGVEIEDTWNYNLYGRDSAGTWSFDSIEDFENKAPSYVEYSNAYTNNVQDIAYDVSSTQYSLYGDATFELFDDFEVTAGLRYEYLTIDDTPQENANFVNTYGFSNTENMDGFNIFLPRVSFNYDVTENLTIRGGIGRFTGGMPLVWVSNAYTNDGVTKDGATSSSIDASEVDFTTVPASLQAELAQGAGSTNQIDPDFELPSDWRYNIAADYTFDIPGVGEDFAWTTEFTYTDKQNAAYWVDLSRVDNGRRTADGGRIIWDSVYDGTEYEGNYDLQLTNSDDGGRNILLTTMLNKSWDNGIKWSAAYTYTDITEANPGTSSTAESNYQYEVGVNRNVPMVGTAYYEIKHRLVMTLGYDHEFFSGYNTNVTMFFERRSGRPFSWTLGAYNDVGLGDQYTFAGSDTYLPYVPTGADDTAVDWANSTLTYEEVMEYAEAAGIAGAAGGYPDKYTSTQPWVTTMDLSISQEIPGFVEGHKGKFYLNIDNFANLLNDEWGQTYDLSYPQNLLYDYDINENGQYVYDEAFGGTNLSNFDSFDSIESTWRIKVGVKYIF
ncbi:TonB-dependent receptor [Alteromonas sp. 1_MG-2023]|uniref:TonB-dependent receptor n=1 Tax=Alteromonas sp. 1_MG-2023 TaxID=3062669 RepID=UPI0026E2EC11|nr:TonB-dependent receptor [Alteromonas sp. 1_MG-2023]MDO6477091.1 TonB-dependent receptor [Alteromonas sp. 1_MG-2023]